MSISLGGGIGTVIGFGEGNFHSQFTVFHTLEGEKLLSLVENAKPFEDCSKFC
jgi:hypothetical protein